MKIYRYTRNNIAVAAGTLFLVIAALNAKLILGNITVVMDNIIYNGDNTDVVRFAVSIVTAIACWWFAIIYDEYSKEYKAYRAQIDEITKG